VASQIKTIMEDIKPQTWKTGMLPNSKIIITVSKLAKHYKIKRLVVDPVMLSASGDALIKKGAVKALKKHLIPQALVTTPNIKEAEVLTGLKIKNINQIKKASKILARLRVKCIVVKGSHLNLKSSTDIVYYKNKFHKLKAKKIKTKNIHGTGCSFAAAIAVNLAKQKPILEAVKQAKIYLTKVLKNSANLKIGQGSGPVNHFA